MARRCAAVSYLAGPRGVRRARLEIIGTSSAVSTPATGIVRTVLRIWSILSRLGPRPMSAPFYIRSLAKAR